MSEFPEPLSENDAIREILASEAFAQEVLDGARRVLVRDPDGTLREEFRDPNEQDEGTGEL